MNEWKMNEWMCGKMNESGAVDVMGPMIGNLLKGWTKAHANRSSIACADKVHNVI